METGGRKGARGTGIRVRLGVEAGTAEGSQVVQKVDVVAVELPHGARRLAVGPAVPQLLQAGQDGRLALLEHRKQHQNVGVAVNRMDSPPLDGVCERFSLQYVSC